MLVAVCRADGRIEGPLMFVLGESRRKTVVFGALG